MAALERRLGTAEPVRSCFPAVTPVARRDLVLDQPFVLEMCGLRRSYGSVVALDGLDLAVPPGKVVGFLGPNGAGKTTAMRAVFGVVSLDSGEVLWKGQRVSQTVRARFGYMPEERGLYPGMAVGSHLTYLARLHGMSGAEASRSVGRWAERLGISDRLGVKIESLSLGNQQRIQLAAALVHDPELLVLDEPFAGLDPVGVETMAGVLAERALLGAAVVFSSHQLDLVEDVCDSVAIVHRGRVVASGEVEQLARAGKVRLEVKVAGDQSGTWVRSLGGGVQVLSVSAGRVLLELDEGTDPQQVLATAQSQGAVEHFAHGRRSLSEIFREAISTPGSLS